MHNQSAIVYEFILSQPLLKLVEMEDFSKSNTSLLLVRQIHFGVIAKDYYVWTSRVSFLIVVFCLSCLKKNKNFKISHLGFFLCLSFFFFPRSFHYVVLVLSPNSLYRFFSLSLLFSTYHISVMQVDLKLQ